jgi:hypothetical protein
VADEVALRELLEILGHALDLLGLSVERIGRVARLIVEPQKS